MTTYDALRRHIAEDHNRDPDDVERTTKGELELWHDIEHVHDRADHDHTGKE